MIAPDEREGRRRVGRSSLSLVIYVAYQALEFGVGHCFSILTAHLLPSHQLEDPWKTKGPNARHLYQVQCTIWNTEQLPWFFSFPSLFSMKVQDSFNFPQS